MFGRLWVPGSWGQSHDKVPRQGRLPSYLHPEAYWVAWGFGIALYPSLYLDFILQTLIHDNQDCERCWTSCGIWVWAEGKYSDFLRRGAARCWFPYGWWRELSAQLQSRCKQDASLAALHGVWFDSSRCPPSRSSKQPQCKHELPAMSSRQQQVLEGNSSPP